MFDYRPYQKEAIANVLRDLGIHRKVGAVLPTGAGKTEVFIGVVDEWLRNNPGMSVMILSHLSLLTTQTSKRFNTRTPHLSTGVLQASESPDKRVDVVVSTMQSSRSEDKIMEFIENTGSKIGLIIVDEAHYLNTESYDKALSYFPDAKVFGTTATPFRSRQIMLNYFDVVSYNISLQELIDAGYLVRPDLTQVLQKSKLPEDILSLVVQLYRTREAGKKSVVFVKTKKDADMVRNLFVNEGIKAESVTCDVNGVIRDDILDRFRDGDTMVLTTVNVLSAGFDAPCLESIFMPYPTKSPTLYMQRIGRGLRTSPGKESCRIYVCGDAPSIARGMYQKVHTFAMNGQKEWKAHGDLLLDLANNIPESNPKLYKWTQDVVDIAKAMNKWNLEVMSEMLITKKFPKRYLEQIGAFAQGLPQKGIPPGAEPISAKQRAFLASEGFDVNAVAKMSTDEARAAISAITEVKGKWRDEYRFTRGKFAGKKIDETPLFYQEYVVRNYPKSNVAAEIRKHWDERKKKWA